MKVRYIAYDRESAAAYAARWAFDRNPAYYSFDGIGGDCTNFASQCLYAGVGVMNDTRDLGWYYVSPEDRAAAWTEANHFRRFMLENGSVGPYGEVAEINALEIGDFISLSNGVEYYHTLVVVGFDGRMPLIAAHTNDSYMRRLDTYYYHKAHGLHILGARIY